jgi:hypothetical protein
MPISASSSVQDTPDTNMFQHFANMYAKSHPTMRTGKPGCAQNKGKFSEHRKSASNFCGLAVTQIYPLCGHKNNNLGTYRSSGTFD